MKEITRIEFYSVFDGLYQVVIGETETKGYAVDQEGRLHHVGLAVIYAEGTPMDPAAFNEIAATRSGKGPRPKPALALV